MINKFLILKSMTTPVDGLNETGKGQGEGQDKDDNAGRKENNSDGGTGSIEAATLMSEVSSLLKSMRSGVKPQINAVRLQRLDTTGQKTVLLDGGATHCLRPAKNEQEWLKSIETPVFLASGTVTLRQVPGSETLVTQGKNTQPIVPLAALTQMGIQITWDEKGCEMKRSDGSKLPVFLDSGCPVMERIQGMELMAEVEHFNRQKTGIRQVIAARRLEASNGLCSDSQAKKALEIATLFPQVPAHLAAEIPGDETIDMSKVPLNRRQRKRIAEAKSLTIHLFSGPQTSLWTCCESEGHVVLCVEIQKGLDLHNSALVAYLESLFRSGRVDLLLAGPPCRTVSLQRFRDDDGPPPVRGRDGLMRFGLPFNTFPNKQLCDQDSLLWLRLLWFSHIGVQANVEMEIGIEQPADPEGYLPPTRQRPRYGFPSFLSWPETFVIGETCSLRRIGFDQGRFGHPHKKPTEMLTNIPELYRLQDLRMEMGQGRAWAEELEKRLKQSKAAAAWAPGLVRLLQEVIKRKQDAVEERGRRVSRQVESETRPPWIDREVGHPTDRDSSMESRDPPGMRALTAADLHDWRQHVANEHQPARRDCSVCLQNMGRDRPHKRITHPSSYCLNLDIAGPFKGGKDQLETLPRYMAVGVFTVPVKNGTPLAEKLREFGKKVDSKEDPELQGDPDLIWGEPEKEDEIDPFASVEAAEEVVLSEAEIQQCEARNQEWREKIQDLQDVQVCSLTLAAPLRSRHATEVQKVLTFFYCKLRAIGLPVVRLHTDRAKEFVSRSLAQWMRDHDVLHTTSSGDESQGSARAEGEIGYLKGRVRLLINASKSPPHYWPLALRHAAEARYRQQMSQFGVPLPRLIPFGTQAMAKFKRWHHVKDKDTWEHPMQRVTVYGPAMDMSSSSRGYYIETNGRWMRSTVVLETKNPRGGALPVENLHRELQDQGEQLEDVAMDNGSEQYAPTTIAPEEDFEDIQEGDEGRALPRIVHVDDQPHQGNIKRRLMGKQSPPTAAGGLDAIVARVMVAMAARNEWSICTADVRTAFLQAERRPTPGKVTIVTPPGLLKETGILQKGAQERWLIQKAIYGLIESPKDWADHRDAILKKVKWIDQNTKKQKWIERTAENHLWQVKVKDQQEPEGFLGVYVDDLIAIGKDGLLDELMEQLTMVFKMAEPTKVTPEKGVTFCGYEIGMDENYNYTISQEKYVEELIKKHQMEGFEAQPLPKVTEAEDEDPIEKKTLRSAQTIAGELLWLMTRSRPDICYAVSLMTRLLHRRPSYVVELGRHVVRYLAESKSMGLKFESGKRGSEELLVKTDTSFAPPVDGYRSVQGTAIFHGDHLLQWSSGRQAFVTLSTAEAELVGYVDGFQQGQSIDGLLKIFGFHTYKRLQGDCKAALAQINSDATAWRTRHLRLRASRLRELVLDRESSWEAERIPGLELAPDGFTKVLVGQAFRRHREQLGMCNVEHFKEKIEVEEAQIRRLWHQEEVEETESLKLSQCLLGAGIAMVCTDHKVLGAMLLATAGLLSVKGRWEQENKRPARKVSRPQQELRERANTPNGSKDEAAHPPIEGITGMAHDVRGDLRDQFRIGANVGSQGFRASRMSSLFSCHGSEVEEQPTAEERLPRLCAFRAPGDPSRDQLPLRPPVDAARAKAREQARSLGTAHRELYRNFDIPQPHHDRQRPWWDDARFEAGPTGQDKWIQTRDGLLIRTHSKLRRRSFHPLHRSVPIEISGLRAERHTVIFADDPESLFVDPRPRFVESDEWSGNTTWTKDYRWRGYTVFVLRSCVADRHEQGQPDYVDPVLAAPKRASRPAGERLPDPRDDDRSGGAAPMFAAASSSSAGGYGSNQREREPAMVQVNVNVYNTSGIATPRAEAPETEDSEFEFVTP